MISFPPKWIATQICMKSKFSIKVKKKKVNLSWQTQGRQQSFGHQETNYFKCSTNKPSSCEVSNMSTWIYMSQFSYSVIQLCSTLCDHMDCSMPGFSVHHQFPELAQTQVHWVSNANQPSHPLASPSPPAFKFSQQQDLYKWVSSSHQVVKELQFQLQHQSF